MIGGYRNESHLTSEHHKLPEGLRRRVGQSIKVIRSDETCVEYVNNLSGISHRFIRKNAEWLYDGGAKND